MARVILGYGDCNGYRLTELPAKVLEELAGSGGKVLKTSLTHEDEAKLQAALSGVKK